MPNQNRVEALLFDMGGVVIDVDFERAFRVWEKRSQLSIEEIRCRFKRDVAYQQHERGDIDASEYFQHLRDVLALEGEDKDIAKGWNAIFIGEIKETLNDILSVKGRFPCFAFTNTNPTHQAVWTVIYPEVVAVFDQIFVSSELGLRKPERAAFDAIAEATGFNLRSMLFFDDELEYLEGALNAGLQTIHVQGPADVRQALVAIGAL